MVRLDPPELGGLRITLRASGDRLRGVVEVDNPDTLRRVEREAGVLVQRLQEAGVQVRRLDVVPSRQDTPSGQENPLADGRHGQPAWQNPGRTPYAAALGGNEMEHAARAAADDAGVFGPGGLNVRI
jgi:flagellar hook-length control protein FliK